MTEPVNVECTAIPDGVVGPAAGQMLRVSVVLTPHPDAAGAIELKDWPSEIPTLAFELQLGATVETLKPVKGARFEFDPPEATEKVSEAAKDFWTDTWQDDDIRDAYYELLGATPVSAKVGAYGYAQIAELARTRFETGVEVGLLSAAYHRDKARGAAAEAGSLFDTSALSAIALARLENPNDPTVLLADAEGLMQRSVFYDLPVGDGIDAALAGARQAGSDFGLGAGTQTAALMRVLEERLTASTKAIRAARANDGTIAADGAGAAASWAPFAPIEPETAHDVTPNGQLARLFDVRYDETRFGRSVAPAQPTPLDDAQAAGDAAPEPEADPVRVALAAYDQAMQTDAERGAVQAPDPNIETPKQVAARHVAAFQAHPTLRKFVKLIVDVFVPLAAVPAELVTARAGVVAVTVVGRGQSTRRSATAFQLLTDASGPLFEPAPEAEFGGHPSAALVPSLPLYRGVVQLSIGLNGKSPGEDGHKPRFRLEVIDALASIASLRRSLQVAVGASRKGLPAAQAVYEEPGLRTRGLMLLDLEAIVPFKVAEDRRAEKRQPTHLYYAEDLVDGYRLDVVAPDGKAFPAGARKLRYSRIDSVSDRQTYLYAATEARDEGYIAPGARSWFTKDEAGAIEKNLIVSEQLLCWSGDNIGLPALAHDRRDTESPPPAHQLPVTIRYDMAPTSVPGPILRVAGRYRYMLRARKLNGSSVDVRRSEALAPRYSVGDRSDARGYLFAPVEKAPVPVVLVADDQVLNVAELGDDQPASETMLVAQDQRMSRYLVVPRIGFDLAEQQGQFDPMPMRLGETEPMAQARAEHAATFGCYGMLVRDANTGEFPKRSSGSAIGAVASHSDRHAAALRFKLQAPATTPPAAPYFVDNSLKFLAARLVPTKATTHFAIDPTAGTGEVAFWPEDPAAPANSLGGFRPEAVRPVLLEVVGARPGELSRIEPGETEISDSGRKLTVPLLRVHVGAGDTFDLELWLNRTSEHLLANAMARNAVSSTAKLTLGAGDADPATPGDVGFSAADALWRELRTHRRIGVLHDVMRFRIEQVAPLPLRVPSFRAFGCVHAQSAEAWAAVAGEATHVDAANADSLFSWGTLLIDRKTTGALWAEAFWLEDDPARVRQRSTNAEDFDEIDQLGLWNYRPEPDSGRLFTIDQVAAVPATSGETPADYTRRANLLSLVTDEGGRRRSLAAEFQCYKARRLLVRLLARSRFASPAPEGDSERSTIASASRADTVAALSDGRIATLVWGDSSPLPGTAMVWLAATRRPPPPKLMKDQGSIYQRRLTAVAGGDAAGGSGKALSHCYRLWLGDDWFASGEGEQLAIVCRERAQRPPDWLLSQLSRWGGDMTMKPSQVLRPADTEGIDPSYLDPSQIRNARIVDAVVPGPGGRPPGAPPEPHDVKLALLTPQFHSGAGRWYCDIEFAQVAAFRVTLKLSVARYQPHALPGIQLSEPVAADAFVLHQPWTFTATRTANGIEVAAMGPAYVGRAPMTSELTGVTGQDIEHSVSTPLIVAELERLDDAGSRPMPVRGSQGRRIATNNLAPGVRTELGYGNDRHPGVTAGCTRWSMRLDLPPGPSEDRLAVRVSLATAHANSLAAKKEARDGALIYLPEPIVVSLPV
ncbi:hypothetical protein [Sphingobium fuliginis]|uniref:Uncharacterized protein n=1 Tax=Sphingobium fuliginis (strain ATCC 27551) TaxID=336203 RepID=A0ABQ1EU50_SPHSA|nr:hypothetical protein [Sphingobium fuliginis]RYL99636.1 hypothetical protein EWH10_07200 [Sphingobium fuliginis]GFZ86162.1 hypothetical protein GCM10019071_14420 [Sphingobium fuliginis]